MPARDQHYQCCCSVCCEVDTNGVAHNPAGKPQLGRYKVIHLRRIARTVQQPPTDVRRAAVVDLVRLALPSNDPPAAPSPARLPLQPDIESLSAALFAATLSDNGPDLNSQPSKLWASRQEYQAEREMFDTHDFPLPDVDVLASAVSRIALGNG
jgi:hypothetical protein